MKVDGALPEQHQYRFIISVPHLSGWREFLCEIQYSGTVAWHAIQATLRAKLNELTHVDESWVWHIVQESLGATQVRSLQRDANEVVNHGCHVILSMPLHVENFLHHANQTAASSSKALDLSGQTNHSGHAGTAVDVETGLTRPAKLRLDALPTPSDPNVAVQIASGVLPIVTAAVFAVFMNSYWFLCIAFASPILIAITMWSHRSSERRKIAIIRRQNHAHLASWIQANRRYVGRLTALAESKYPSTSSGFETKSSQTGDASLTALRLGRVKREYPLELEHDIERELVPIFAQSAHDQKSVNEISGWNDLPTKVEQFLCHMTGTRVGSIQLTLERFQPALIRLPTFTPVPGTGESSSAGKEGAFHFHVQIKGEAESVRSLSSAILRQIICMTPDSAVRSAKTSTDTHSPSWLTAPLTWVNRQDAAIERRGFTLWVDETGEQNGHLEVTISHVANPANDAPRLIITLIGKEATLTRAGSFTWDQISTVNQVFDSHHHEPLTHLLISSATKSIYWEGLRPAQWERWVRQNAKRSQRTRHLLPSSIPFEALHNNPPRWTCSAVTDTPAARVKEVSAPTSSSIHATVGVTNSPNGPAPLLVDLATDGPHMFIAGTTGSGKSEFLRSFLLSLCHANPPESLQLVLLDFKGGAGFASLAALPQVASVITNLDEANVLRSMSCLLAEVTRRQRIFNQFGTANIVEYHELAPQNAVVIPRLVIVVDEFRVFTDDHPDSRDTFVRLAAVGRSLGIHLILATQRPGGSLSADLAANIGLRVGLRVSDRVESIETLGIPDASVISASTPGRGIITSASGSREQPPQHFQSLMLNHPHARCFVDKPSTPPNHLHGEVNPTLRLTLEEYPADSSTVRHRDSQNLPAGPGTDSILEVSRHLSHSRRFVSPILPELPSTLKMVDVEELLPEASSEVCLLGISEAPAQQLILPATWSPSSGATLIVGAPGTGKSTLARVLQQRAFQALKLHKSAIWISDSQPKFEGVPELASENPLIHYRSMHDVVAMSGTLSKLYASTPESRVMVVVDNLDSVQAALGATQFGDASFERDQACLQALHLLLTAARPHIDLVVTGSRKILYSAIVGQCNQQFLFAPSEPQDYLSLGVPSSLVRELRVPGRCIVVGAGTLRSDIALLTQIALP